MPPVPPRHPLPHPFDWHPDALGKGTERLLRVYPRQRFAGSAASPARLYVRAGTLPASEKAKVKDYYPPPPEEKAAAEAVAGRGEDGKEEEGGMDPEEALRAFAESVGMPVDAMWDGVTRGDGGEIVEIDWSFKGVNGTLPVGDMLMPYLRKLNLLYNKELKGETRGVGVAVVRFCLCE